LPFAPEALAYQVPSQKVAPEFGREPYFPSQATDYDALRPEAARSGFQRQQTDQDDLFRLWDSVSDELKQAWQSIRIMFR
jgi:hypothetical protein